MEAVDKVLLNQFQTKLETTKAKPRSSMDSVDWGHRSPANDYGGRYSPHNGPFIPWNGPYLVRYPYPYLYTPPAIMNSGYMMNQTGTSNDTGMMAGPLQRCIHNMQVHMNMILPDSTSK
ncbi:hypothetical protein PVAP13_3NG273050 [Panicum virgatum]|uniref:Uncharacterized protein n=1 Tax=Panicum virgatum TaxID=38727 RepID=A0A8T0UJM0_PANVG|nr:hypothetical protein PVAP13_3NG273050 [Panicum virgatum]